MNIVISSGHGKLVRGASGYLDEVDEARRVVDRVAAILKGRGVGATVFHDDVSHSQDENLKRIVDFHNSQKRDFDVSVHFNAYEMTGAPMGTECLFLSQGAVAQKVVTAVASDSGLKNRGPKKRTDLYFLNKTDEPAILIEVCFVDSRADADIYEDKFEEICQAISECVSGQPAPTPDHNLKPLLVIPPVTIYASGDGSYVKFTSDLDICNDGSGPSYNDPSYQSQTAYYNNGKFLNADVDKYIVIPPQVRKMVPPVVMGCRAKLTNIQSGLWTPAVTGEIGPDDKTGEAAYCAAKVVNPAITHNSGDKTVRYLYELWPGVPAVVDGKTYKLEPA